MRFGLLLGHQLPRPWAAGAEAAMLEDALELVALADRLGLDRVWVLEHHFLEEFSHSSAPAVFLAAASQRASRIRLGLANVPLPPGFGPAARVAEQVATLDLLTGGRVDLGTAEGMTGAELGAFGVNASTRHAQWEEVLGVIARMLTELPFAGSGGRWASMPPRTVVPRPEQQPHPPLWLACARRDAIRTAAEKGLGALSLAPLEPAEAANWVCEYRDVVASERCVPAGLAIDARVSVTLPLSLHADEAEAIERGIDGAHFWHYAQAHYETFGDHRPGRTDLWEQFTERRAAVGFAREPITPDGTPLGVRVLRGGASSLRGAVGTPGQVRELVAAYAAAGVDELVWIVQAGRTAPAHARATLELFAAEVLPAFAGVADAEADRRARELAPAVEAALARRSPPRTGDPGYAFGPRDAGPSAVAGVTSETFPALPADGRGPAMPAVRVGRARLRQVAQTRGEAAFRTFVRRSDDQRLERTVGTSQGLRVLFGVMQSSYAPDQGAGFTGELCYELRTARGELRLWTLAISSDRVEARPGRGVDPRLVVKLTVADFVRIAGGDLDAGKALLTGRMDLTGDFSLAARLGSMFGQS
jgi:alkanesulfonate monooxygenase SsuD/methylene tetrahydromethanopterin reductase-like flavin-dependent oxidoreductase (luciferase family)/putative sterol carrier protein